MRVDVKGGSREWEAKEMGKFVALFFWGGGGGEEGGRAEKHLRFA